MRSSLKIPAPASGRVPAPSRAFRLALTCALAACPLAAQLPAVRPLAAPTSEFAEPFSALGVVLELADGRVLVHDAIERRFAVVDLRTGASTEVARPGGGPREYRGIHAALRVAGDSVLAWDPQNDRVHLLAPDGSLVGPWASGARDARAAAVVRTVPREVDARGRLYANVRRVTAGDSTSLVRIDPATGAQDTLARFATLQLRPRRLAAGVIGVRAPGFPAQDAWGVLPDGRVLYVHGTGYVPEVIRADGRRTRAPAIPHAPAPVSAADRAGHLREVKAAMEGMLRREAGGGRAATIPRVEVEAPDSWPAARPPVLDVLIRVDARQRGWVRVADPAWPGVERYDLLDGDGRRVGAVRLGPGVRVVGMGKDVVYTAREDADDLLWLERRPLP